LEDIAIGKNIVKQEEQARGMMIFQNSIVIVKQSQFAFALGFENVVVSRMVHVMSSTREHTNEYIQRRHLANIFQII
jgi:hypothetical protein